MLSGHPEMDKCSATQTQVVSYLAPRISHHGCVANVRTWDLMGLGLREHLSLRVHDDALHFVT